MTHKPAIVLSVNNIGYHPKLGTYADNKAVVSSAPSHQSDRIALKKYLNRESNYGLQEIEPLQLGRQGDYFYLR